MDGDKNYAYIGDKNYSQFIKISSDVRDVISCAYVSDEHSW